MNKFSPHLAAGWLPEALLKLDNSINKGKKGVITAHANILTRVELGATLTYDNVSMLADLVHESEKKSCQDKKNCNTICWSTYTHKKNSTSSAYIVTVIFEDNR